jgi:hypothetical protein
MRGTPFSAGQLGELEYTINIGITTILPKVADKFGNPEAVLRALEGKGQILAGHLELALEQAIRGMMVLVSRRTVSLQILVQNNPDAYFRTRTGLWVSNDFRSHIVAKAQWYPAGTSSIVVNVDEISQEDGAADKEIEGALPTRHLFDETDVCAIVETMISKQPNGMEGDLENTGKVNLFYTSSYVVRVGWRAVNVRWYVETWRRDESRWDTGGRVFSPAN